MSFNLTPHRLLTKCRTRYLAEVHSTTVAEVRGEGGEARLVSTPSYSDYLSYQPKKKRLCVTAVTVGSGTNWSSRRLPSKRSSPRFHDPRLSILTRKRRSRELDILQPGLRRVEVKSARAKFWDRLENFSPRQCATIASSVSATETLRAHASRCSSKTKTPCCRFFTATTHYS